MLALDQGGQSSRALVFDERGALLARAARTVAEARPGPARVEQDPEELVRSLREAADEAVGALGARRGELAAAGLATQRSSLACWERASGRALAPILSWQDTRAAGWLARFEPDAAEISRRTGLRLSPHYGASKLAWCLEHVEAVRAAREAGTLAAGPLASFLAARLCAERPCVADAANATRTLLFDPASADWDDWLLARFGIPRAILPRAAQTRGAFGTIEAGGVRVPLCVLTGDQSAALYAAGEPRAEDLLVNLGTGAFVQRVLEHPARVEGLLTSLVRREDGRSSFVLEGTINGAGSALALHAAERGEGDTVAALERALASTEEPPLFLNGVSGLAAPYWRADFRSRFVGGGSAAAEHAAVAESVLFLVLEIERAMRCELPAPRRIVASGGLSRSDALCARLADLAGLPVERASEVESTACGLAWLVRGVPGEAATPGGTRFEPRADARLAARHARWRDELARALKG